MFWIRFRNSAGRLAEGYIETSPGTTLGDYAWKQYQEPFHYYNSNGSSLVVSATETIGGKTMRVFTVKKAVAYCNSAGKSMGTLSVGTKIATTQSLGATLYPTYMWFEKKKVGSGAWTDLVSDADHGYVDLGLDKGSMPYDRAIY